MKKQAAFTLVELMMAVLIFSFVAASLATLYSTANRHLFKNYRQNSIKANVSISMAYIRNTIGGATRLDFPGPGASGNVLGFANNVDQMTGCYPVSPAEHPAQTNWHYFCLNAGDNTLYYHTGAMNLGTCACPPAAALAGCAPQYPAFCGPGGGGSVTRLMQYVLPLPGQSLFSRQNGDTLSVRVKLRSFWDSSARGYAAGRQTDVDFTLESAFAVSRLGNP